MTTRELKEKDDHRILSEQFVIYNNMTREDYYSCLMINNNFEYKDYPELTEYIGPEASIVDQHLVSKLLKQTLADDVLSAFTPFDETDFVIVLFTYDKEKRPMPVIVANTPSISDRIREYLNVV